MKQILFATMLCVFAIVGCKRDAEPATPAEPATTTVPAAAAEAKPAAEALPTDVISEADNSSAPAGFDVKAFAGTFGGDDIALELEADGSYTLSGWALGGTDDEPASSDGTWTVEENGKRIRLDPNSKDEDDWLFAVNSNDELQALDGDGKPPANAPAGSLTRVK